MANWNHWTEPEDAIIRDVYPDRGAKATVKALREQHFIRTEGAVKERTRVLGVKRDMRKMTRNAKGKWTQAEIDILRKVYPIEGAKGVRKVLLSMGIDRTIASINVRASMCGVMRHRPNGGEKTIRNICLDTKLDVDIIDKLDSVRNRSQYVRELVSKDIGKK